MDVRPASTVGQLQSSLQPPQSTSEVPPTDSQDAFQAHSSGPNMNNIQLYHQAPHRLAGSSSAPINPQGFPMSNGTQANIQKQSHHQNQQVKPSSWSGPGQTRSKYPQPSGQRYHHNSSQSRSGRQSGSQNAGLAPHLRMLATHPQSPLEQTPYLEPLSTQPLSSSEPNSHPPLAPQSISSAEEVPHRRQLAPYPTLHSEQTSQSRQHSPQTPESMFHPRSPPQDRKLYDPKTNKMRPNHKPRIEYSTAIFTGPTHAQVDFLERLAMSEISKAEMSIEELDEKETFRLALQQICRDAVTQHELERDKDFNAASVSLKCFGSLSTGFATHSSDMDLALVSPNSKPDMSSIESNIPRVLEKALLDAGYGARLLTKTRVPIIKLCEKPTTKLRTALLKERSKWEEERDSPPVNPPEALPGNPMENPENPLPNSLHGLSEKSGTESPAVVRSDKDLVYLFKLAMMEGWFDPNERQILNSFFQAVEKRKFVSDDTVLDSLRAAVQPLTEVLKRYRSPPETHLDFPKDGVGIQCDINFSNPLALHNTRLLRCYSLCDPRVRLIVIFVKAWAKQRRINSPYHGTLSSYGYVLMVLHYLANIVEPAIIPNLQQCGRAFRDQSPENSLIIDGYNVRFWRSETEIRDRARRRLMTKNHEDNIGIIICGFFHYFAHQNGYSPAGGFSWSTEVLSLRTRGGILRKKDKGWTGAKSVVTEPIVPGQEPKEIRHRYLLAIEDPFETEHNIARTVIHHGIVSIRDEFRRAVSIIQSVGLGNEGVEELFAEAREKSPTPRRAFGPLLRKDDAATNSTNPLGPQGGVLLPRSSKGEPKSQAAQKTDQITAGMNQLNIINSVGTAERRKFKYTKNKRGNESLHSQTTPGPSSYQPTPVLAATVLSSNSGGQPHPQEQDRNVHP